MHFHHKHDIDGCTDDHDDWPDFAAAILATLDRRELQLMSQIQDSIDAAVTVINELSDRVKVLEAASQPPANTTALDAAVTAAQTALPAPAPVDQPADPAPATEPIPAAPADQPAEQPAAVNGIPSVPLA